MSSNEAHPSPASVESERLGRYELISELSPGAIGGLWAARIVSGANEGKIVCVRRIAPREGVDAKLVQQVCEAAWTVMELRLRGVLPLIDVVVADGRSGLVRDHVEGDSLATIQHAFNEHGVMWTVPLAVRVGLDVLDALSSIADAAAKQPDIAEFLFGGLSPDRVLIQSDGRSMLADLELVGSAVAPAIRKQAPALLAYRAPEHAREGGSIDARTDQFVWGAILWELLAGKRLLQVEGQTLSDAILAGSSPRLDAADLGLSTAVSKEVADVIERALQRDPERRFATSAEMRKALEEAAGGAVATSAELAAVVGFAMQATWAARRKTIESAQLAPSPDKTPRPSKAAPRPAAETQKAAPQVAAKPTSDAESSSDGPAHSPGKPVGRINIRARFESKRPPPVVQDAPVELSPDAFKPPPVPKFDFPEMPGEEAKDPVAVDQPLAADAVDKGDEQPDASAVVAPAADDKAEPSPDAKAPVEAVPVEAKQESKAVEATEPASQAAARKKKMIIIVAATLAVGLLIIIIAVASGGSKTTTDVTPSAQTSQATVAATAPAPEAAPEPTATASQAAPESTTTAPAATATATTVASTGETKPPIKPAAFPPIPLGTTPIPTGVPTGKKTPFVPKGI